MLTTVVLALALVRALVMYLNLRARPVGQHAIRNCVIRLEEPPSVSLVSDDSKEHHLYPSKVESGSSSLRAPLSGPCLWSNLELFARALRLVLVQ